VETVYVAMGCALGGVVRYLCAAAVRRRCGDAFPWGTLLVNLAGSFLLGALFALELTGGLEPDVWGPLWTFAGIGFCGGLTTFSTFSQENLVLLSRGARVPLALNLGVSVLAGLLAAVGGYLMASGGTF